MKFIIINGIFFVMMFLLAIKNWAVWTPDKEDSKIATTSIPAGIKRRCSEASKMALEISHQALNSYAVDYAVFCSQHGELNNTINLLKSIYDKEILSPMGFSQSVHNTAAGLFSVIHKLQQNMTSIAAGESTFLMGMLDAITWLALNPNKTVLLTMFDTYIPQEYSSLAVASNYKYAVSLILTNDPLDTTAILLTLDTTTEQKLNSQLPDALEFVEWLQSPKHTLNQQTNSQQFQWCKN